MIIGRVIGEVVCTVKFPKYDRQKLLQVQPLGLGREPKGGPMTAIDLVDSGVGDEVLVCLEGQSAVDAIGLGPNPVDAVILGVIDAVSFVPAREDGAWTTG